MRGGHGAAFTSRIPINDVDQEQFIGHSFSAWRPLHFRFELSWHRVWASFNVPRFFPIATKTLLTLASWPKIRIIINGKLPRSQKIVCDRGLSPRGDGAGVDKLRATSTGHQPVVYVVKGQQVCRQP